MALVDLNGVLPARLEGDPPTGVAYRNEEEFNKALDAAAEKIRTARGIDLLGWIWFALLALQAIFYLTDWLLDWEVAELLIPGVDLRRPLWFIIVMLAIFQHGLTRNSHERILRQRLCFQCGRSLLNVVTENERGQCPDCATKFSVAQYRRPEENRGRQFAGYLDTGHFDATMTAASERIREARGMGLEKTIHDWTWLALLISFVVSVLFDWSIFDGIPYGLPWHGMWFAGMGIWSGVLGWRANRIRPSIIEKKLCLSCGYSLLGTRVNDEGVGRCPECSTEFAEGEWTAPPEDEEE